MPAVKSAHHKIMIDGLSDFWHLSIPITQVLYPFLIGKLLVKQKKPTQCLYKEELYINVLPWRVTNYSKSYAKNLIGISSDGEIRRGITHLFPCGKYPIKSMFLGLIAHNFTELLRR